MRRATAFIVAAGLVAYLAMRGGGYDIVVRQEVGLTIWGAVALGFALGVLPRSRPIRTLILPLGCSAALLLWMLASLHWTESEGRTTAEIARFLTYAGMCTLAIASLNRHTFRAAAAGLSVAVLGMAAVAIASRLDPSAFPSAADVTKQFRTNRLSYPLGYWNAVGAWGAMAVAIGLAWSAHARSGFVRGLALAAIPIAGLAVYLSYSRAGVIGSAVAVVMVLVLARNRWTVLLHGLGAGGATAIAILVARGQPAIANATGSAGGTTVAFALLGAAAICAGAVFVTEVLDADRARIPRETANWAVPAFLVVLVAAGIGLGHGPVSRAWDQFQNQSGTQRGADPAARLSTAGGNRYNVWGSAIDAFQAHPLDGTGPGTFEFWHQRNGSDPEYVRDAHSLYLEHLAELGLPGLILLLGSLGGLLAAALLARKGLVDDSDLGASVALTAAFVVFCFNAGVDWMWEETAVGAVALGGIAIAAAGGSERRRSRRRRGPLLRPGVRGIFVALAIAAAAVQVPGLISTQRIRASQAAFRNGDLPAASSLASDAVSAEPWAADPRVQLGLIEEEQGRLREARGTVRGALSREPTNWQIPLVLSRVDLELGQKAAARRMFEHGRQLAPHSPFYVSFSSVEQEATPLVSSKSRPQGSQDSPAAG